MIYRPNYCCNCGEKIERVEWPLLASRRFCDLCKTEHQTFEWLPRIIVGIAVVFGAAGLIGSLKRPVPTAVPNGVTTLTQRSEQDSNQYFNDSRATPQPIQQSQTGQTKTVSAPEANSARPAVKTITAANTDDAVYHCGAATKKGTACTRRVKHQGERCWQHRGMPSMTESVQGLAK